MVGTVTLYGIDVRYSATAVECDGTSPTQSRRLTDCTFECCGTGVYANDCAVTLSSVATNLVTTPSYTASYGTVSGAWASTINQTALGNSVAAEMLALAQGHSITNAGVFGGSAPTNFTWNTNCWTYGLKGYTAFSPYNTFYGSVGAGTLITSKHAIASGHMGGFANVWFTFVGKSGINYQVQCTNQTMITASPLLEDISLLTFNTNLPASDFDFVRLISSVDITNKLKINFRYFEW
jgi:hypothetical protein